MGFRAPWACLPRKLVIRDLLANWRNPLTRKMLLCHCSPLKMVRNSWFSITSCLFGLQLSWLPETWDITKQGSSAFQPAIVMLFHIRMKANTFLPMRPLPCSLYKLEKVVGLTGFVIIHVFIASFSPAQRERNQIVNAKFTRPVNAMPMSSMDCGSILHLRSEGFAVSSHRLLVWNMHQPLSACSPSQLYRMRQGNDQFLSWRTEDRIRIPYTAHSQPFR